MGSNIERHRNNTFAGAPLLFVTRQAEMEAFDLLPPELQRSLNESASKLTAVSVVNYLKWCFRQGYGERGSIDATRRKLAEIEQNEITVFAGQHFAETGLKLPHTEAAATVLRYDAGRKRRTLPQQPSRDMVDVLMRRAR